MYIELTHTGVIIRHMVLGFHLGLLYTIFIVRWVYVVSPIMFVRTAFLTSSENFIFLPVLCWDSMEQTWETCLGNAYSKGNVIGFYFGH